MLDLAVCSQVFTFCLPLPKKIIVSILLPSTLFLTGMFFMFYCGPGNFRGSEGVLKED